MGGEKIVAAQVLMAKLGVLPVPPRVSCALQVGRVAPTDLRNPDLMHSLQ